MKTKFFGKVNYIGWIVIILSFVFMYFWYFLIYIPKNESHLKQKAFRILKEFGNNMVGKDEYYANHFKNYSIYYLIKYSQDLKKIKANDNSEEEYKKIEKFVQGLFDIDTTNNSNDSSFFSKKENNLFLKYNYQIPNDESKKSIKKFYEIEKLNNIENSGNNSSSVNTSDINVNKQSNNFPQNLHPSTFKTTKEDYVVNKQQNKVQQSLDSYLEKTRIYQVQIDTFMKGLRFDELFENIIFFDKSMVYYNSNFDKLADITNPAALCDSTNKMQGGIYKILNIKGEDKHIMILPFDFKGDRFYIAGFITDNDYRNKTRTINKQLLIFIAGFLLLVLIGIPILKIIFIDPHERLNAIDASGSGISFLFGISLFILIIIGFSKKQIVDQVTLSKRIQMISDSLYINVTTDIDSIKKLSKLILSDNDTDSTELSKLVTTKFKNLKEFEFFQVPETIKNPFLLNEILLIDSIGFLKKAVTYTPFSNVVKVNLSERQYFKNAKEINNSWSTLDGFHFYIESIQSYNTGKHETAISFNTKCSETPVLTITSEIPSLYQQVLPKDIEFVIIDNSGKVLYHSIKEKNLHENFIQESESDLSLINAINMRVIDKMQLNYNEKSWLARIKPITGTPLYHITLLDLNQSDNKNARIFLFTFYFMIASLILSGTGMLILTVIMRSKTNSQKRIWFLDWMILDHSKYHIYKLLCLVLSVIIVFQLLGIFINEPLYVLFYQLVLILCTFFVSLIFLLKEKADIKILSQLKFLNHFSRLKPLKIDSDELNERIKRTYLAFVFLWLTSISAIPVVGYYFSIKKQEEKLWKQEQIHKVAQQNIDLFFLDNSINEDCFKRVQGNGLDYMNISYITDTNKLDSIRNISKREFDKADKYYANLPDPISNWFNPPKLSTDNYVYKEFIDSTLYFRKGTLGGAITVSFPTETPLFSSIYYLLLIFLILTIVTLCVFFLLKYLAREILNLNQVRSDFPKISWIEILKNDENQKIRLNTFDGECYLEKSRELLGTYKKIETIQVSEIIAPKFKFDASSHDSKTIIWISGFKQIINDVDKHEKLLLFLNQLNQNYNFSIVVDLSFDIDLINEFYDEYIAVCELTPEQLTHIFLLRKKWNNLFNDYFKFDGFLNQNSENNSVDKRTEDSFKSNNKSIYKDSQFLNIWSNLTSYEKIDLFDLADDGLLNLKNKDLIQKLINKRLIIPNPNPTFFSDEFGEFVRNSIKSSEIKAIETKLGLTGRWHKVRYLLMLIILPVIAFIIISQGISVEKVIAILAGGLAIITGVLRLLDSSTFRQS